jgi:phosphohistidine phosphatase SixA
VELIGSRTIPNIYRIVRSFSASSTGRLLAPIDANDDSGCLRVGKTVSHPPVGMSSSIFVRSLFLSSVCASPVLAQVHPTSPAMQQHHASDSSGASLFLHARPEAYLLTDQLRKGGLIIVMRHGKTDANGVDVVPIDYRSCSRQRNLSASGRAANREVAESWAFLGVKIAAAVASPYCRVIETATALVPRAATNDSLAVTPPGEGAGNRLLAMLRSRRAVPGSNLLLVGHVISVSQAFDIKLQEGESLVLEPGTLRVLGRVTATEWGDVHRDTKAHGVLMVARAAATQSRIPAALSPAPY